ncbi:MAG: YchF family ATPase [Candidatus Curtissbacteria bacterium]|nr:YchF family ATPase [Candidatus Curtissbacteria bacterium]
MNLSVGIVGLPNVGKSTLFNALLKKQVADAQNYPFTTIEPNVGVVEVPDPRLFKLADVVKSSEGLAPNFKIIPAVVKFVDIAGLVKGAASGEGLGNQFLSHIREVDAIVFVLRDFSGEVIRVGSENPQEDLEVLKTELLIKDLETIDKRIDSLGRELKPLGHQDPKHQVLVTMQKAKQLAEEGKWLGENMDEEELAKIRELQLLSTKKTIVVLNTDEGNLSVIASESKQSPDSGYTVPYGPRPSRTQDSGPKSQDDKKEIAAGSSSPRNDNYVRISAKLEQELSDLDEEEQGEYLKELGIGEPGLNRLIKNAYETLGLITFFTAGPKEVHAWTTNKGVLAPQAAGVIHTDFEKGFIAAEVIDWETLVDVGGWQAAKGKGQVKTIGKTEEVKDGMVVEFRFSN